MKVLKLALIITLAISMIGLAGCDKKQNNKDIAETFAREILTIPNEEIAKVAKLDVLEVGAEELDKKTNQAIEAAFGDVVAKDTITDAGKTFYTDVIMLHIMSTVMELAYTVESIDVTELNQKQFSFTAKITSEAESDKLTATGSIQFDDEGKINFVTLKV